MAGRDFALKALCSDFLNDTYIQISRVLEVCPLLKASDYQEVIQEVAERGGGRENKRKLEKGRERKSDNPGVVFANAEQFETVPN